MGISTPKLKENSLTDRSERAQNASRTSCFSLRRGATMNESAQGVISSIAAAKALLRARAATGAALVRPLEVIAFGDEEGVRFTTAPDIYLSSEALYVPSAVDAGRPRACVDGPY